MTCNERSAMKFSLQNITALMLQCDAWVCKISKTESSFVALIRFWKCCSHCTNNSKLINPESETLSNVPAGASLKSSGFLRFLGNIITGGMNVPTVLVQQTTVTLYPLRSNFTHNRFPLWRNYFRGNIWYSGYSCFIHRAY